MKELDIYFSYPKPLSLGEKLIHVTVKQNRSLFSFPKKKYKMIEGPAFNVKNREHWDITLCFVKR